MNQLAYGIEKKLTTTRDFDAAVQRVTEELAKEGFGVLTTIDVKATLKKKIDADFRPYVILGACNPRLAHRALQAEGQIGLLLPCNVVVQEVTPGEISVSVIDPAAMFQMTNAEGLGDVVKEADERLRRALGAMD